MHVNASAVSLYHKNPNTAPRLQLIFRTVLIVCVFVVVGIATTIRD